jgi:hypothetical protein
MWSPLWSPVVATGGERLQMARAGTGQKQAKTVAVGCNQLPPGPQGKEGVSGSSPEDAAQHDLGAGCARRGARAIYSAGVWGNTSGPLSPGPIVLLGWSGDDRWVFFAIDPGGSGSIAADGLILQVVSAAGRRPRRLGVMLTYRDYFIWCAGRLVFTGGGDRIAIHDKRLLVATPPSWRPRSLVRSTGRSWGSLACAPGGRSLVVQSQASSTDANFFHTHWALWQVGLNGSQRQLTHPPAGFADESPRFARDGHELLFVRSRKGIGKLYLRRGQMLRGPLLSLGYSLGFYGHQDWWQSMDWSLAAPR